MTNQISAIPDGYRVLAPYLIIKDAAEAIEFYKRNFDAVEQYRVVDPSGKILFAELRLGDSQLMLADEFLDWGVRGPKAIGGTGALIHFYTGDVDTVFEKAVSAGSKVLKPVSDQFTGDRLGQIEDPFGHVWFISTHKQNVTPAEMQKRATEMFVKA
jgi:PhnB protein